MFFSTMGAVHFLRKGLGTMTALLCKNELHITGILAI